MRNQLQAENDVNKELNAEYAKTASELAELKSSRGEKVPMAMLAEIKKDLNNLGGENKKLKMQLSAVQSMLMRKSREVVELNGQVDQIAGELQEALKAKAQVEKQFMELM